MLTMQQAFPNEGWNRNGKQGENSPGGCAWPRKGTDAILLGASYSQLLPKAPAPCVLCVCACACVCRWVCD